MKLNLPRLFGNTEKITQGYISTKKKVNEDFKGEVNDPQVTFPKSLGAEHPFSFEDMEKIYKSVGVITGAINKITDSIVGDFAVKTKKKQSEKIINDFIKNTNFTSVLREWIREGFTKGNGFLELDVQGKGIQVLNANNMYVKRSKKGKILEYNMFVGNLNRISANKSTVNTFNPNQIAHLRINKIAGEPYGIGIIYQNERTIENMVLNEQELQKLISRKAGAPIHVTVGREGETVNPDDVDNFNQNLQYINNRTEWVTDSNVKMNVLDFGQIGKNYTDVLDHDMLVIAFGMEIPIVLFGGGNIPEGLAKAQSEIFQRKISAIQEEIESIIEERIFKPLLEYNGIDDDVEFSWNLPGEEEINNRIDRLSKLLENMNLSEPLRRMCELEIAKLLNIEDAANYLSKPEKETDEDKANRTGQPQPGQDTKPPEPEEPVEPPKTGEDNNFYYKHKLDLHQNQKCTCEESLTSEQYNNMPLLEFVNLKEAKGYSYSELLDNILKKLKIDKFEYLAATTRKELADGKLPDTEIDKLRGILESGFEENKTMKEIESEIKKKVSLKDVKKDGKVIVDAAKRPNLIARTETIRFANLGLVDTYKDHGIKKVRWQAAVSERTCDICNDLDGQVFDIDTVSAPPKHIKCRCTLLSVLK